MTPQVLEELMSDIEEGDPLDFSDLAIEAGRARALMANHFCALDNRLSDAGVAAEGRLAVMAAIAAHTMEANFLIQLRRLSGDEADFDLQAWMARNGFA